MSAVLAEAGGQGLWPEADVDALEHGVRRAMKALGMLERAPDAETASTPLDTFAWTRSEAAGCWYPTVRAGQRVAVGERLGTVTDLLGAVRQEARSVSGAVLFVVSSLAINAGDPLAGVGA